MYGVARGYLSAVANLEAGGGRASERPAGVLRDIHLSAIVPRLGQLYIICQSLPYPDSKDHCTQSTVCNIALLLDFLCRGNIKFSLCIMHIFNILLYVHAKY